MMKIILFCLIVLNQINASTLVMIGGGPRPKEILSALLNSSPKEIPNVLVLPWGTESPQESCDNIKKQFLEIKNINFLCLDKNASGNMIRKEINQTDILYFPGGDQNKVMAVLKKHKLVSLIKDRFKKNNMSVGGTSAGTAIQSQIMLNGRESDTAEGLGLLVSHIVDQHFLVRLRQERLKKALVKNKISGMGIDEGTAAIIKDGKLTVLGESQVWLYNWPDIENPVKLSRGMEVTLPLTCDDLYKVRS